MCILGRYGNVQAAFMLIHILQCDMLHICCKCCNWGSVLTLCTCLRMDLLQVHSTKALCACCFRLLGIQAQHVNYISICTHGSCSPPTHLHRLCFPSVAGDFAGLTFKKAVIAGMHILLCILQIGIIREVLISTLKICITV